MKKYLNLFCLIIICLLLSFCKKGEDDPFLTLQSRKARLAGTWKMSSGEITIGIKDSTGAFGSQRYVLTENEYTFYRISNGAQFIDICNLELVITKDGAISIKQVMDSISYQAQGIWDFTGRVGESKNKESIKIQINSINNKSYFYRTFNKGAMAFVYRIRELRNKKLVLENKEEIVALTSGAGIYITSQYTFVQ